MPIVPETGAVLRVMIASPRDMAVERDVVESAIAEWNALHSRRQQAALLAVRWEYAAVPVTGIGDAQRVLDRQLLDGAHILITLFGHRIGTATPRSVSGTVEEVNEALTRGMPVHVLFSKMPVPADVDLRQLDSVRRYEKELKALGLNGYFASHDELRGLAMRCLVEDVDVLVGGPTSARGRVSGAVLRASLTLRDRVTRVRVQNEGDVIAKDVEFSAANVATGEHISFLNEYGSVTLGPAEAFEYRTREGLGAPAAVEVTLRWREGNSPRNERLVLRG